MGTHLYVCDNGGPMVVATVGPPPRWITCPVCTAVECARCDGAQLSGDAQGFAGGAYIVYRCEAGHEKPLRLPVGKDLPESVQCVECDGVMLPTPPPALQ